MFLKFVFLICGTLLYSSISMPKPDIFYLNSVSNIVVCITRVVCNSSTGSHNFRGERRQNLPAQDIGFIVAN